MDQIKVGKLCEPDAGRDAIHVAIFPATAQRILAPGQYVGFVEDGNTELVGTATVHKIGIVDPFLKQMVQRGDRFYVFLFPQTITGLRHVWSHPAFPEEK